MHGLAAVNIHRVVDGYAQPLGRLRLHDGGDDGRVVALVERGACQAPCGIEQIGRARQPAETFLDGFEASDRDMKLLADARIGAGDVCAVKAVPAADSDGSEMPRPAASALISIFQPLPTCSTPPMT